MTGQISFIALLRSRCSVPPDSAFGRQSTQFGQPLMETIVTAGLMCILVLVIVLDLLLVLVIVIIIVLVLVIVIVRVIVIALVLVLVL